MLTKCGIGLMVVALIPLGGCGGLTPSVNLKVTTDCAWARKLPELTSEAVEEISSNKSITYETAQELNQIDINTRKHNELFLRYCG